MVEQRLDKAQVTGSSPVSSTTCFYRGFAKMAKAPGFDPGISEVRVLDPLPKVFARGSSRDESAGLRSRRLPVRVRLAGPRPCSCTPALRDPQRVAAARAGAPRFDGA